MPQVIDPLFAALVNGRASAAYQTPRRNSGNTNWEWGTGAWLDVPNTFTVGPQTVQTGADGNIGQIVKAHSGTQSANLQEWQNSSGTALVSISPAGELTVSAVGDFKGAAFTSTGDRCRVTMRGINAGAGTVIFDAAGGQLQLSSSPLIFYASTGYISTDATNQAIIWNGGASGRLLQLNTWMINQPTNTPLTLQGAVSQSAPMCQIFGVSSTSTAREQANIDTAWIDSTDATRKSRLVLSAWDTAAREGIRIDATGSTVQVGIGGAVDSGGALLAVNGFMSIGGAMVSTYLLTVNGSFIANGSGATQCTIFSGGNASIASLEFGRAGLAIWQVGYRRSDGYFSITNVNDGGLWRLDDTTGRMYSAAPATAPTDGNMSAGQISFYLDEVGNNLKVRVLYSDGTTYKTGTVALT